MGTDDLFKKRTKELKDYKRGKKKELTEKPRILIVCEGERTEPSYFECFRPANIVVRGYGYNTDSLVEKAIEIKEKDDLGFDQVWCVFDRDSFPAKNFNRAFELAKANDIQIAYSNESFELWYYLHFDYLDAAINRHQYCDKLTDKLGFKYEKNKKNSARMYHLILPKQGEAIKRAKTLLKKYEKENPEKNKPSTTVYLLVEELNKWNK